MSDMDVHLVAAFGAFTGAIARHQLGGWARRPELDHFAHGAVPSAFVLRLPAIDLGEGAQAQ
jgi:hypothetical protein